MPNNLLPTKGNLIAAKHSRGLAQTGFELMDRKRNILIRELMGMMDTAKELQGQIDTVFTEAYAALQAANIRLGICDRIAEAVEVDDSLTLRYRSVMGVELPRIPGQSPPPRPEYGLGETCSELDECYLKFHKVKELTRRLAEVETSIYRLADAIKKTQKEAGQCPGEYRHTRPGRDHPLHHRRPGGEGAGGVCPAEGHQAGNHKREVRQASHFPFSVDCMLDRMPSSSAGERPPLAEREQLYPSAVHTAV